MHSQPCPERLAMAFSGGVSDASATDGATKVVSAISSPANKIPAVRAELIEITAVILKVIQCSGYRSQCAAGAIRGRCANEHSSRRGVANIAPLSSLPHRQPGR